MADGGHGEPGKPGERGEAGVRGGGAGGLGGFGGAGGRGGGYRNGNNGSNGNGNKDFSQWIPTVVMILAVFGFWWGSADPKARLDKIEANQLDNRKELNESITAIRKELSSNFLTLREHQDFQKTIKEEMESNRKIDDALHSISTKDREDIRKVMHTKEAFEAWKAERDSYLASILKRIDYMREELLTIIKTVAASDDARLDTFVKTAEKTHDAIEHRIDQITLNVARGDEKLIGDVRALAERIDRQDTPLGKRVDGIDTRVNSLIERTSRGGK